VLLYAERTEGPLKILVVGAGAVGGYIGVQLVRAHRDVTFLVRPSTLSRLNTDGVRIRGVDGVSTTRVNAVTRAELGGMFDDMSAAVGVGTRVIPLMNGMAHLPPLIAAFGEDAVLGAAAELATSLLADGTIEQYRPGAQLEIGDLAGHQSDDLRPIVAELGVDGVRPLQPVFEGAWPHHRPQGE
jgi:2-dehydropantoate 2-reductase